MNKIEEKYGLKPVHAIALFVILVLNITWIVCDFIIYGGHITGYVLAEILMFVVVAFYALYGYKVPHGNHMRYLLLCHTGLVAYSLAKAAPDQEMYLNVVYLISIIASTYMAGRLHKLKQNIIISIIVLVCTCIPLYEFINMFVSQNIPITFSFFMSFSAGVWLWLAIAGAYITRFKLHKQAGFEDKK